MAVDGSSTRTAPAPAAGPPRAPALGLPWSAARAAWKDVWPALLITRLLVLAAGWVALAVVGERPRAAAGFDPQALTAPFGALGDLLVAPAARWDSVWYLTIAHDGYGGDLARPAFFPLYPLLARAAGAVVGGPLTGGIVVSGLCLAGALVLLHRLTALELGDEAARLTVWVLAAFPMSFFLSAVYAEALFLLLSVGCLLAARTERWAWAAGLGVLATATRSAGLVLLVPLAVLAWEQRGSGGLRRLAWPALVPVGAAAFSGWLAWRGAGASTPYDAQAVWNRELSWPLAGLWDGSVAAWEGLRQLASGSRTPVRFGAAGGDPFEVARLNLQLWAFLALALVAVAGVVRRLPPAYAAYVAAALALPLSTPVGPQPLMSLPRFELVLFPLAMWGGWWLAQRGRVMRVGALVAGLAGLVFFTGQFTTWRWVA